MAKEALLEPAPKGLFDETELPRSVFVMMVGVSSSGKTTNAIGLEAGYFDVSRIELDDICFDLYGSSAFRVLEACEATRDGNRDIFVAACNGIYVCRLAQENPDRIFLEMKERALKSLETGCVVLDAPNLTRARRQQFLEGLPQDVRKVCIYKDVSLEVALRRNTKRRYEYVPEDVIRAQMDILEPPTETEGWDYVERR